MKIKIMWYIHTMEFSHNNEIMPFAVTWIQIVIITLSEISQKEKYHMISLT